jgi:hypothetical protein
VIYKENIMTLSARQPGPFNPNEHLMQLKSKEGPKDYLPVQWRLVWFREQCPQGTIDIEEVCVDLDREVEEEAYVWNSEKRRSEKIVKRAKGYARFKAIVTDGKGARSTGTKSETAASFPDYIEKAETGAIGRALAGLGYGTQFAPDLSEAHRIVDAPVARQEQQQTQQGTTTDPRPGQSIAGDPITAQQLESVRKICDAIGQELPENLTAYTYLSAKGLIQELTQKYRVQQQQAREQAKVS